MENHLLQCFGSGTRKSLWHLVKEIQHLCALGLRQSDADREDKGYGDCRMHIAMHRDTKITQGREQTHTNHVLMLGTKPLRKKNTQANVKPKRGQHGRDVSPRISGQGSTITNEQLKPIRQLTEKTIPRV